MQVHANYGPMSMASYGNFTTFWPYLEKYSADFHDRETKMIGNVHQNMKKASNSGGHPFSPQNMGLTDFWVKWSLFTLAKVNFFSFGRESGGKVRELGGRHPPTWVFHTTSPY